MAIEGKCCGTCKWFYQRDIGSLGACSATLDFLPDSVSHWIEKDYMFASDGANCPCWETK